MPMPGGQDKMPGPLQFAQRLGATCVLCRAAAVEKAQTLTNCIGQRTATGGLAAPEHAAHDRDRFPMPKGTLDLVLLDHSATVRRLKQKVQRFLGVQGRASLTESSSFSSRESRSTETQLRAATSSMRGACSRRRERMTGPRSVRRCHAQRVGHRAGMHFGILGMRAWRGRPKRQSRQF